MVGFEGRFGELKALKARRLSGLGLSRLGLNGLGLSRLGLNGLGLKGPSLTRPRF